MEDAPNMLATVQQQAAWHQHHRKCTVEFQDFCQNDASYTIALLVKFNICNS